MRTADINIYIGSESKDIVSVIEKEIRQKRSTVKVTSSKGAISIHVESEDALALISSIEGIARQLRLVYGVRSFAKGGKAAK